MSGSGQPPIRRKLYVLDGPRKKVLPNWAVAAVLTSFVAGTYFYSMKAVGDDSAQVAHSPMYPEGIHLEPTIAH